MKGSQIQMGTMSRILGLIGSRNFQARNKLRKRLTDRTIVLIVRNQRRIRRMAACVRRRRSAARMMPAMTAPSRRRGFAPAPAFSGRRAMRGEVALRSHDQARPHVGGRGEEGDPARHQTEHNVRSCKRATESFVPLTSNRSYALCNRFARTILCK
jgi:hypothetical protein